MNPLVRLSLAAVALILATHVTSGMATEVVSPGDCSPLDANPCIYDALKRAASRDSDVVLLPGAYTILHPVNLISGVSILGTSGTVIQPSLQNSGSVLLFHGEAVHDIRIEGITFDGGGRDFPNDGWLVVLNGTQNVVLDRVTMRHSRGPALAFYSDNGVVSNDNGIQNSHIFDVGNCWRTSRHPSDRRMSVEFYDLVPLDNRGNFAVHNRFEDIGLDAIHVAGQNGFVGDANFFSLKNEEPEVLDVGDFPAAFFAETNFDMTIRDNTIHEAMGNCIDMPGVQGALIEGNTIVGCGQSGIGIFQDYDTSKADSSDITIRNNVILNSAIWAESWWKAGITIAHGRPTNITIEDNVITDMRPKGHKTQDYGIEVVNDPQNNIVTKVKGLTIGAGNRLDGNQRARTHGIK